jgi:hypothetical protein
MHHLLIPICHSTSLWKQWLSLCGPWAESGDELIAIHSDSHHFMLIKAYYLFFLFRTFASSTYQYPQIK